MTSPRGISATPGSTGGSCTCRPRHHQQQRRRMGKMVRWHRGRSRREALVSVQRGLGLIALPRPTVQGVISACIPRSPRGARPATYASTCRARVQLLGARLTIQAQRHTQGYRAFLRAEAVPVALGLERIAGPSVLPPAAEWTLNSAEAARGGEAAADGGAGRASGTPRTRPPPSERGRRWSCGRAAGPADVAPLAPPIAGRAVSRLAGRWSLLTNRRPSYGLPFVETSCLAVGPPSLLSMLYFDLALIRA